jgi:CubicO group peptidase (beta-lactamase class C family)
MLRISYRGVIAVLTILLFPAPGSAQVPFRGFDEYVEQAMETWKVPGMAIAIVRDDSVVFARGYGVRTLETSDDVNERTLFAIGSSSKAFTVATVGMLVDAKQASWDDPVTRHLPGFEMYDQYAAQEMTIRDLLSHRSGLARGDLLWYGSDLGRDEIVRRIRFLEPSWSFRSSFGYQNLMYLAAGQIVARLSGASWDDVVHQRIFEPLGMTASNTSVDSLVGQQNVATPHAEIDDTVRAITWRNIDNVAPAGSINSNVIDVAQWVRLHLNDGEYGGERILSSAVVAEMQKPNTIVPQSGVWQRLFPEANFTTYGMGWFLQDHRGEKVVQHGGNIDGMSALVAMIPSENLGLVILTNMNGSMLPTALMYRIFDAYLGAPEKDWSADLYEMMQPLIEQQKEQEQKVEEERVPDTSPSHALEDYAGIYVDPDSLYGEAELLDEGGHLVLRYGPSFVGDLSHWHYETFRITWRDSLLGKSFVTFAADHEGKIDEARVENLTTFERKPETADTTDAVALTEAELRRFVGRYSADAPPIDLAIEFLDGRLQAVLPGQPAYTLASITATSFRVTGVPFEATVEFVVEDGRVSMVVLKQQGYTFELSPVEPE